MTPSMTNRTTVSICKKALYPKHCSSLNTTPPPSPLQLKTENFLTPKAAHTDNPEHYRDDHGQRFQAEAQHLGGELRCHGDQTLQDVVQVGRQELDVAGGLQVVAEAEDGSHGTDAHAGWLRRVKAAHRRLQEPD